MQDKNKHPTNKKGEPHGDWIEYNPTGKITLKGYYINGKRYGRWERYWNDGSFFIGHYIGNDYKGYYKADWSGNGNIDCRYIAN